MKILGPTERLASIYPIQFIFKTIRFNEEIREIIENLKNADTSS